MLTIGRNSSLWLVTVLFRTRTLLCLKSVYLLTVQCTIKSKFTHPCSLDYCPNTTKYQQWMTHKDSSTNISALSLTIRVGTLVGPLIFRDRGKRTEFAESALWNGKRDFRKFDFFFFFFLTPKLLKLHSLLRFFLLN